MIRLAWMHFHTLDMTMFTTQNYLPDFNGTASNNFIFIEESWIKKNVPKT
jgi:hypothetical protein